MQKRGVAQIIVPILIFILILFVIYLFYIEIKPAIKWMVIAIIGCFIIYKSIGWLQSRQLRYYK